MGSARARALQQAVVDFRLHEQALMTADGDEAIEAAATDFLASGRRINELSRVAPDALAPFVGDWEWGVRGAEGNTPCLSRDHAIDRAEKSPSRTVIRRRPGGPWEDAPEEALRPLLVEGLDIARVYVFGPEDLGQLLLEAAGAATRPLMEQHPSIVFPADDVARAVSELVQHDQTAAWLEKRSVTTGDIEKAETAVQDLLAGRRP